MRLRLRIERNALPSTQALWPVKDTKCTIAQLLQNINEIFPLEVDTWGLEDYSISIGGYECLHYYEIAQVCRDEDEILIKPLQFVDARSRTLTGRDQIAADGRHLLDGVPFGRPALRAPIRPDLRIPPRKKQKLLHDPDEASNSRDDGQLMLTENEEVQEDEVDEDEEDDEDFEVELSESDITSSSESEESGDDSDTSSSDEDSSDEAMADTPESDYEDAESWDGIANSEPPTPSKSDKSTLTNGVPEQQQTSLDTSNGKKRKRGFIEPQNQINERASLVQTQVDTDLPVEEEKSESQKRNHRKRDVKKLKHLVSAGELEPSATLATMHAWQEAHPESQIRKNNHQHFEERREKLMAALASGGIDLTPGEGKNRSNNKRRKVGSNVVFNDADASIENDDADEPPLELTSKAPPNQTEPPVDLNMETVEDSTASSGPRPRLDLAGSKRLVFGSLGVRVPKTQAERDQLQQKLADQPKRAVQKTATGTTDAVGGAATTTGGEEAETEEDEDWRSKINLTAVECCDEDVVLSEPPFPFHQRWDPQYKSKKARQRMSSTYMGKRKRGGNSEVVETYDKYHVNGETDALDYDDVEDEDEFWEEGALLDGASEDEEDAMGQDDGFPELPPSTENLPVLSYADARTGDFVTYSELACDESTEWQPQTVTRMVQIIALQDEGQLIDVQLSRKDFKPRVYDEEGNRVYSKFEMPDEDDDEEEDGGKRNLWWRNLGVVRLVLRPEAVEINGG